MHKEEHIIAGKSHPFSDTRSIATTHSSRHFLRPQFLNSTPLERQNANSDKISGIVVVLLALFFWNGSFEHLTGLSLGLIGLLIPLVLIFLAALYNGIKMRIVLDCLKYLAPIILLSYFSVTWSENSQEVLNKSTSFLLLIAAITLYISSFSSPLKTIIWSLAIYGIFHSGLSLLLIFSGSELARSGTTHLVGVMTHKTALTNMSAICAISALGQIRNFRPSLKNIVFSFSIILSASILLIGDGGQAKLGLAVGLFVLILVRLKLVLLAKLLTLSVVIFAIILPFFPPSIMDAFSDISGKDVFLSGRVYIWNFALDLIANRPLLGHGFFNIGNDPSWQQWQLFVFEAQYGTYNVLIPNLHNQWIETLFMLGAVGLFIVLYKLVFKPLMSKHLVNTPFYSSALAIFTTIFTLSAFGTSILKNSSIAFIFFTIVLLMVKPKVPKLYVTNEREGISIKELTLNWNNSAKL